MQELQFRTPATPARCARMVSGIVRRLVEIEAGSNATESQFFLEMERRMSLRISIAVTLVLVAVIAWCGLRH